MDAKIYLIKRNPSLEHFVFLKSENLKICV